MPSAAQVGYVVGFTSLNQLFVMFFFRNPIWQWVTVAISIFYVQFMLILWGGGFLFHYLLICFVFHVLVLLEAGFPLSVGLSFLV